MNQTNITETLRKADDYYQKAIDLDTKKNYKDALVLYDSAKQVYESVYKFKLNDIESTTLNLVETNLKRIYNRIVWLNNNLQKQQQQQQQQNPVQIMYPQVPFPPSSYAGIQNYPPNTNYLPQGPLYNQLPSLSEIGNMNAGGSPSASPQTSYPQFNPGVMPQEANSSQQQYYYQQGQVPNQIQQQQQNQIQAQLYQQPQSQQNIQQPQYQKPSGDQHQSSPQSNTPLPTSSEDNHHQKVEKKKFLHWGKKKKDDDTDNDKDTKKKKHDKKHDEKEKNKQLHDQDQQKPAVSQHPQQNPNQYPNQQQPNWQQVQQVNPQANQLIQNQMQPQFSQPQQLMQSQMAQQQMLQQPQQPIQPQSQLYRQPPQTYQPPQQYQIQYPQPGQFQVQRQFSQPQSPSREITVDPTLRNNNSVQSHHNNNSDSQSYDSGYDYDQDKTTGSTHRRTHHVLMSDQIIQPKDYTIKSKLGKGANGMVYLVTDVHTKKEYAMKELLHQLISSDEQKSFFREIELMIHANHPAVLKLVGFSMTNSENKNSPILILELMPNGSLQDVIDKKKSFTLTQKYIALYGIAEAMKYLHSKDIVHRDLKPANVLLNQYDEPAVADFGLSKLMSQELMRQTQAAGSPVYMAPELMMRQDYNNSIDVYAYGYICYELLLEELSFSNVNNVYDLVNMVCNGTRPPLNGKNLDDEWKLLISNCWDANPYERPTFHQICQLFIERTIPFNNIDMNRFAQYEAKIKTKK